MKFTPGKGIAGDVMKTGKAELINNVTLDARFVQGQAKIHSMLCVPIRHREEILGVINMSNTSDKMFTIDDLNLLHSLALYSWVAISNARSFSSLKQTADELLTRYDARHVTLPCFFLSCAQSAGCCFSGNELLSDAFSLLSVHDPGDPPCLLFNRKRASTRASISSQVL